MIQSFSFTASHFFFREQLVAHFISNETLVGAIYLFISYDVPNAADGWNRSPHSLFLFLSLLFFFLPSSSSFLPWVCMRVSIAGLKKKIMTRRHRWRRERERKMSGQPPRHHPACVRAMISSRSFFFSLRSPRTVVEAHIKLILLIQTSYTCPFFVRMYIYTLQYCQRKSHFYRSHPSVSFHCNTRFHCRSFILQTDDE